MPKPPPRKPLFCPPVSSVSKDQKVEVPAKPKPGEKGWLENMMKKVDQKEDDQQEERMIPQQNLPETSSTVFQKSRPKPGEKGWLVALADSLETPSTQEMEFSSSQQSDMSREGRMRGGSEQQSGSQEGGGRPKPREPGWLVAIADNMETNPIMQEKEMTSSQQSRDMFYGQSASQAIQRPKPGEPGWLVCIAESLEEVGVDRMKHQMKEKMMETTKTSSQQSKDMFSVQSSSQDVQRPKPSQDSGKGKSIPSQASKTSNSQVSSSQSSVSSAFELLASEEVTSQVILYQEEVVKQSQASQQEVVEDLTGVDTVPAEEAMDNEVDAIDDNTEAESDANTPEAAPNSLPPQPTTRQSAIQTTSSSSQLSNMLDQILSDMKSKAKNTPAEDTMISTSNPLTMQKEKDIPSLDIMSLPFTQSEDCTPGDDMASLPTSNLLSSVSPSSSSNFLLPLIIQTSNPTPTESNQDDGLFKPKQFSVSKPTPVLASKSMEPPSPKKSQVVSKVPKKSAKVVAEVPKKSTQTVTEVLKKPAHVMSKAPKKTAIQSAHVSGRQLTKRTGGVGQKKGGEEVRSALLTLQKMRTACTWVMCNRVECGKWRYLAVKDPSLVEDKWECKDNPDQRYGECGSPEQWWDQGLRNKFVENRFTVGSLVWAKIEGWPAWPGMVDDDPDVGQFFWTGVRGGEWEARPHQYHVIFFDAKEKGVSRAWVSDRRMERFVVMEKMQGTWSGRLTEAVEMARQAGREDLETRRKKFCLAVRFKGPWGPVWPGWGEEEGEDDSEESESETEEEICREVREEVARNTSVDISMTDNEFLSEVLSSVPDGIAKEGRKRRGSYDGGIEKESAPKVARNKSSPLKTASSPCKENVPPPVNCAQLYLDKSLYTQELSQPVASKTSELHQASFHSDGEGEENFNSSLDRGMDKAMQVMDSLTPVKHKKLTAPRTPQDRRVLTPSNNLSLLPPPSPALSSLPPSTPSSKSHFHTSTPVRKSSLISPRHHSLISPASRPLISPSSRPLISPSSRPLISPSSRPLISPSSRPLISPSSRPLISPSSRPLISPSSRTLIFPSYRPLYSGGDTPKSTPLPPPPDKSGSVLNTTSGSTAFSADGSFMEL